MKKPTQLCSINELHSLLEQSTFEQTGLKENRVDQPNSCKDKLRILDASWYLPSAQRRCKAEFTEKHITGAQFFDIDAISNQRSDLPHMLPSAAQFADDVTKLGIDNDSSIIIYDSAGLFSAARVWWMFKVFGHKDVRVLDGGLQAWINAGGLLTNELIDFFCAQNYHAILRPEMVAIKADLISNCETKSKLVLDARSSERFYGQAPEPRADLPSGHMPASKSLPFNKLVAAGKLKSPQQLQALFADVGVDASTKLITSCGSGVTAAVITLALMESGLGMHSLYDGAWAEWGAANGSTIIDKGEPTNA